MDFRRIAADEADAAHALYLEVVAWLKAKGVRQWLRALTREEFRERQARGELFAAFEDGRMVATVCLAFEEDDDWEKWIGREKRWWIKTLAVARASRGRDLGRQIVEACEAKVLQAGADHAYLECVDVGFLPRYYGRLGYEVVQRADITYPSGNTFPVALMRKALTRRLP